MATGKLTASQAVLHNLSEHCYDQFKDHQSRNKIVEANQFQFMHQFLEKISKEVSEGHTFSTIIIRGDNP